jgi:putative molybdopterin biosynthesis protein
LDRRVITAKTAEKIHLSGGRREYLPVNVIRNEIGMYKIYPVPGGSGAITTLAEADGFIDIPSNKQFLDEGESVQVELFSSEIKPVDLMIIGSHCLGIDILLDILRLRQIGFTQKVINVGSSGGLAAIRRGEADISGIHLLDEETGIYNVPFLKRHGIADVAVLIRGYNRQQGLIVEKGNPKNIQGIQDILRQDLSFINRNRGSGTRVLLDMSLKKTIMDSGLDFKQVTSKIKGYQVEAKSHTSVAVAVLQGNADIGMGIRTVAERYGLDFIPIALENYDFVVRKERLQRQPIQDFFAILRSKAFKEELKRRAPGLVLTKKMGETIYPI